MSRIKASFLVMTLAGSVFAQIEFGPYSGAVTDSSFAVVYRLSNSGISARLIVSKDSSLSAPLISAPVSSLDSTGNAIRFVIGGRSPSTVYYYAIELNGTIQTAGRGNVRTFPNDTVSFSFGFGNSFKDNTGRPDQSGLSALLSQDIAFFLCTGDLHYDDIAQNSVALFRTALTRSLQRIPNRDQGRICPFVYMWDDHDFGPNDSNKDSPGRNAARQTYQELIPHYPLGAGSGNVPIYQAFSYGRVRFILTDLRSERDPNGVPDNSSKTMMGSAQRTWFLQELVSSSKSHDVVFWVSTVPWTAPQTAGGDHWGGFTNERRIIADAIKANNVRNLVIISGDAHCLGANNGLNAAYATGGGGYAPEILAAPIDGDDTSIKGGPWSEGTWLPPKGANAYGLVNVRKAGDSILVRFSGRSNSHEEKISLAYTILRPSALRPGKSPHRAVPEGSRRDRFVSIKHHPGVRLKIRKSKHANASGAAIP